MTNFTNTTVIDSFLINNCSNNSILDSILTINGTNSSVIDCLLMNNTSNTRGFDFRDIYNDLIFFSDFYIIFCLFFFNIFKHRF